MALSRRRLVVVATSGLAGLLGASTARAFQGLEQFGGATPPCADDASVTPGWPPDHTFRDGAPARVDVTDGTQDGRPLLLNGTVAGVTCGRIAGARVDLWQADGRGRYDARSFTLRGHQITDREGGFRFRSIVPGVVASRAPRLGLRVRVPGKADFATELFFPGDARNARDPRFREQLLLRVDGRGEVVTAFFNVVLAL